jgi:epoxyqueuosine reductase
VIDIEIKASVGPAKERCIIDREYLQQLLMDFSENSPTNYLSPPAEDTATLDKVAEKFSDNNFARNNLYSGQNGGSVLNKDKSSEYVGMRFFLPPAFAIGSALDARFRKLKEPQVIGPHHLLPEDWLPGARSIVSIFLPFTSRVIESNTKDPREPSWEWLFTRVDGQQHLLATGALVRDALVRAGHRAVVPYADDRFIMRTHPRQTDLPVPPFSSNWSERHVAYITGLGTFGRMTNFISKRGACGRLVSVVTDWETEPEARDYDGMYDYCSECGTCYLACPAGALSVNGKDINKCSAYLGEVGKKYAPRYGCGKCQSGLPCSTTNLRHPNRRSAP